jgi:hypothetical protein
MGKGLGREIPLPNVERLRPKFGPESEIDPRQELLFATAEGATKPRA